MQIEEKKDVKFWLHMMSLNLFFLLLFLNFVKYENT